VAAHACRRPFPLVQGTRAAPFYAGSPTPGRRCRPCPSSPAPCSWPESRPVMASAPTAPCSS